MTGWVVERGLGEIRAARVDGGQILEMRIRRAGDGAAAGDVWDARLIRKLGARRGIVGLAGEEALLEPLPAGITEGALIRVEVVREAIPERGRPRLAKAVHRGAAGTSARRIAKGPELPPGADAACIEGWDEAIGEAESGVVAFGGGLLTLSPTPAMTLIDVDGDLDPPSLALAGAKAAAAAILKFDIGGSIGIDLPTVRDRELRAALGGVFDAALPQPFERTAVNGFGFLQIVRPRRRASILERVQNAPVETAALALVRQAVRAGGAGVRTLTAREEVVEWLRARVSLVAELRASVGADIVLVADPALALSGGHVHAAQI